MGRKNFDELLKSSGVKSNESKKSFDDLLKSNGVESKRYRPTQTKRTVPNYYSNKKLETSSAADLRFDAKYNKVGQTEKTGTQKQTTTTASVPQKKAAVSPYDKNAAPSAQEAVDALKNTSYTDRYTADEWINDYKRRQNEVWTKTSAKHGGSSGGVYSDAQESVLDSQRRALESERIKYLADRGGRVGYYFDVLGEAAGVEDNGILKSNRNLADIQADIDEVDAEITFRKKSEFYNMTNEQRELIATVNGYSQGLGVTEQAYNAAVSTLKKKYGMSDDDITINAFYWNRYANKNKAQREEIADRVWAEDNPFISSVMSVPEAWVGGVSSAVGGIVGAVESSKMQKLGIADPGLDPYSGWSRLQRKSQTSRDEWMANHDLMIGNYDVGDLIYSVALSTAESFVASQIPGGAALLGVSAGSSAMMNSAKKGFSTNRSIIDGIATGLFEGIFEAISIGNIDALKEVKPNTFADIIKNMGKSMGVNFTEEALTEAANVIYDGVAHGELSESSLRTQELMAQGMSYTDALKQATMEDLGQVLEAGLSGLLMGTAIGGAGSTAGYVKNHNINTQFGQAIRENGEAKNTINAIRASDDRAVQEWVKRIDKTDKTTGQLNAKISDVGAVAREMYSQGNEKVRNIVDDALSSSLIASKSGFDNSTEKLTTAEKVAVMKPTIEKTDNKVISVSSIESVSNGTVTVKDSEGNSRKLDIDSLSGSARSLWQYAADNFTDPSAVQAFVDNYEGEDISLYGKAFSQYYNLGAVGAISSVLKDFESIVPLSQKAVNAALDAGVNVMSLKSGVVDLTTQPKTESQELMMSVADGFGKKYGLNISIVDSLVGRNTEYIKNGYFTRNKNQIVIALDTEGGAISRTLGHETYHYVQGVNSESAKALETFVIDNLTRIKGKEWVDNKLKSYETYGYEAGQACIDELVADSMFDVFSSERAIAEFAKKDRSFFEKFVDHIKKIIADIKNIYSELVNKDNKEISAWQSDMEALDKLNNMMLDALAEIEQSETQAEKNTSDEVVKYSIKYPRFSMTEIQNNMIELAQMKSVADIHENKLKKTGLKPSEIFEKYFDSLGNNIYSEVFGDIALKKSSVKSEIRHGITSEKIASIEAIPSVIESGKVIFFGRKKDSDVDRIVVAAPIKIGEEPYYMGVMLQRDSQNQRLYIHNLVIEKEMSTISQADLLTTGALESNEHLFLTNILRNALYVKKNQANNDDVHFSMKRNVEEQKKNQLDIINETNPAPNTYSTWIRTVDDIKTLSETLEDNDWEYEEINPDLTRTDIQNAIESGEITVYSSYPIKNGVFVSPSRMEAESYSGNGKVYEKTVDINDVAWIDPTQGQYAKVDDVKWSFKVTQDDINEYVENAYIKNNTEDYKKYAEPSDRLVEDLKGELNLDGYAHALRDNDIRHIRNSHGEKTNEKYPVTRDDIKQIPYIVQNYDKVYTKTNASGELGIVYVKVGLDNIVYYVEAVTSKYHNENLLVNKQMVKAGINEIPNLRGLINAINKKESSSQYLADLQKIRKAYAQSVKENYSNNSISNPEDIVKDSSKKRSTIRAYYLNTLKENKKFRDIIELLGKQGEVLRDADDKVSLNSKDIRKIAYDTLRKRKSKYDIDELEESLNTVYDYIENSDIYDEDTVNEALIELAKNVLEKSETKDAELWQQHSEVRRFLKNTPILITENVKNEIVNVFGDYKSFRSSLFGKVDHISTTNTGARTLDEVWGELSEMAPEYFPEDANELDMPMYLTKFYDVVSPKIVNPYKHYEADINDEAGLLATELLDAYYKGKVRLLTDYKAKYNNLLYEYDRKLTDAKKALEEDYEKKVKDSKEREIKRYKKKLKEYKQERETTERNRILRYKIGQNFNYLNRRLTKETDREHIPENYKDLVRAFCGAMADEYGYFSRQRLVDFLSEYRGLDGKSTFYDEDMVERIKELIEKLAPKDGENQRFIKMDSNVLSELFVVGEHIKHIVKSENLLFSEGIKGKVSDYATAIHNETKDKKSSSVQGTNSGSSTYSKAKNFTNSFMKGLAKPGRLFKSVGSETLYKVHKAMRNGENTEGRMISDSNKKLVEIKTKNSYDPSWKYTRTVLELSKIKESESRKYDVTVEELMALYALSKREQARKHLLDGGARLLIPKKGKVFTDTARVTVKFTESDLVKISDTLTENQKKYVDDLVEYLSKDIGAERNKVSMILFGINKYNESYYFPITVDENTIDSYVGKQKVGSTIKNQGSSKRINNKASNPLVVNGFTDTCLDHIYDSIQYCSYAVATEDFAKILNYRGEEINHIDADKVEKKRFSTKNDIQRVGGVNTLKQIENFMVDLNGGNATHRTDIQKISSGAFGRMKKAAVMGSLSVVIQQNTAIYRAMAAVEPKYFGFAPNLTIIPVVGHVSMFKWANKADIAEMKKYNGCALIKEIGYHDVNIGRTATDFIDSGYKADKSIKSGWTTKDKFKNLHLMDKVDSFMGWGASKADEKTWGAIWKACKKKVAAENPSLSGEALLESAAELFQDVISETQVYDSVFSKPEAMRSKDGFSQMATMFMSEPLTSLNMLAGSVESVRNEKEGTSEWKAAKKYRKRAFVSYTVSLIAVSAAKALIYSMRDDDEDKSFAEKYISNFASGIVTDILGMIPFVNTIMSILDGYTIERPDTQFIATAVEAFDAVASERKTPWEKIMNFLKAAGQASGIPLYNVLRDGEALLNTYKNMVEFFKGEGEPTTGRGILYLTREKIGFGYEAPTLAEQTIEAYIDGDTAHYEKQRQNMLEKYEDDESKVNAQIVMALKKQFQDGEITQDDAKKIMRDVLKKDDDKIYWQLDKWNTPLEEGESYSKYDDFYEAVSSGNVVSIAKEYTQNGVSKKTLSGQITKEFKPQYIELYKTNPARAETLKNKLLNAYVTLGYDRKKKSKDIDSWVK